MTNSEEVEQPAHLAPPDYETPLARAKLIAKIQRGLVPLDEEKLEELFIRAEEAYINNNPLGRNRRRFIIEALIRKFGQSPLPRRVDAAEIEPILHRIISHVDQDMEIKFCPTYTMAQAIASYLNGDKS